MSKKRKIINREISWLAFNKRVLSEAGDQSVPLMERLRFLGIFSNNRDEFFRVRVASVKRLVMLNEWIEASDDDPKEVLDEIQEITIEQQRNYESIYKELIVALKDNNVHLINERQLDSDQEAFVREYYEAEIDPIIGPVMLNQVKRFPQLRDKAIYLAVMLNMVDKKGTKTNQFALLEVPNTLPRFVKLPNKGDRRFIMILDDIIRFNLRKVFDVFTPESLDAYTFKITRDAELDLDNDISKSFLEKMKKSLKARKRGAPVRFVFDSTMPKELQKFLAKKMNLQQAEDAFIPGGRYHNLKDLMSFPNVAIKNGYYDKIEALQHPHLAKYKSMFSAIDKRDVMLHYPYQTFDHIIDLLNESALDPKVKSIRMCLYRVAPRSKVVNALINAARNGKKVIAVFELQARFDEENNIYWSNILEDEGVKVYFGFPGLKVHGKICLISRKESGQTVYYANIGTGNFNEKTAALYGDYTLLTADPQITREVKRVFQLFENAIWPNYRFKHLVLSPFYLRNRLVRLINKEIRNAKAGKDAYINLKLNSLVDKALILKLYQASNAGVKIRMVVRGICSLIPGVPGMSENIEVISIIDRFLEHARFYNFCNDGEPLYFISSADWMVRNIDRRIEVTCPIYDKDIQRELDDVFNIQFKDNVKASKLLPSGDYEKVSDKNSKSLRSQYEIYDYFHRKSKDG